ncbi:MAG: restriction endonuclease [Chloroflexi bacterium]|nr:restriction endonuclease [Chloroflexota bacterium]
MLIRQIRTDYHKDICREIVRLGTDKNSVTYPNFADASNRSSVQIALEIVNLLDHKVAKGKISDQAAGNKFESITRDFLQRAFEQLKHLRGGTWNYSVRKPISSFNQYEHLAYIDSVLKKDAALNSALRGDYIVKPDVLIGRTPVSEEEINSRSGLIGEDEEIATLTPLRARNQKREILHASISCKWTIRSDRSQNTRTEALNLIRHRKGNLPHIVAVTAEPLPTRIAALALGTGDLDCVYHFALTELEAAVVTLKNHDQHDVLQTLIQGHRLRDIGDLPFDLAV